MIDIVTVVDDKEIIYFQIWLNKCKAKANSMRAIYGKSNFTKAALQEMKVDISLAGVESLTCFNIQQMELTLSDICEYDVYTRQIQKHGLLGLNINLQALKLSSSFLDIADMINKG